MTYFGAVRDGMRLLAEHPQTLFVGQSVRYDANAMFRTMQEEDGTLIVPMERRIELPVIEDFQMGYCTGLALAGYLPVCIFARWDFALLAANQMVNHLDKLPFTAWGPRKVIIRVGVGAKWPLNSGQQQTQDHTAAFRLMLKTVEVLELNSRFDVVPAYKHALEAPGSVLISERADLYNE